MKKLFLDFFFKDKQNKYSFKYNTNLDMQNVDQRIFSLSYLYSGFKNLNKYITNHQICDYQIINLCNQKTKLQKITQTHTQQFPILQYCPPIQLEQFFNFIQQLTNSYRQNPNRIFFIHSKDGKGRTIMFITCFLININIQNETLDIYNVIQKCCKAISNQNIKELINRGQIRYIKYFYSLLMYQQQYIQNKYVDPQNPFIKNPLVKGLQFPLKTLISIQSNQLIKNLQLFVNNYRNVHKYHFQCKKNQIYEYQINEKISGDYIIVGKYDKKFRLPLNTLDTQIFFEQEELDWQDNDQQECFWIRLVFQ